MALFVSGKLFYKAGEGSGGGGGSDQHNLGYYATQAALEEAHPTAEAGDWAIVGATDTVWIWDEDNSAWVDSDQKGQVTSVNNMTGAVTLGINDVAPTQTGYSGYVLGTDGFVAGWVAPEQVQRSAMPQASEDEEGNIYQFTGATDANYTNGYFYKCVATQGQSSATVTQTVGNSLSDLAVDVDTLEAYLSPTGDLTRLFRFNDSYAGQTNVWSCVNNSQIVNLADFGISYTGTPVNNDAISLVYTAGTTTYDWERTDVQPAPVIPDPLPSQTGNSGKFLTTDGTDASWSDKPLVNTATGTSALTVGGVASTFNSVTNIGVNSQAYSYSNVLVGYNTSAYRTSVAIGGGANAGGASPYQYLGNVVIGYTARTRGDYSIAIGHSAKADANGAIQISATNVAANQTNSDANTMKVANANGNFEIMSADGTIPEARLADTTNAQEGQVLTLNSQGNAEWKDVSSSPTTAPTLVAANWSSNQQTVNVTGVTATNTVIVAPYPTDAQDYADAGILCIGQGSGTLTFSCVNVPASDLQVNVVII